MINLLLINNKYNLPPIQENIEDKEFNYREKYRNLYIRLIDRCKNMSEDELSGYNEEHHILPKTLGGSDDKENIILMPVRYHIMAHIILSFAYPNLVKVWWALWAMISPNKPSSEEIDSVVMNARYISNKFNLSSRLLADLRSRAAEMRKGENSPNFGKKHSDETKKLQSIRALNRSEESKRNIANGRRGVPTSKETKIKIRKIFANRKISEEGRKLRIGMFSGGKNGMAKKVLSPDGKTFDSLKEAAVEYGIKYKQLSKIINSSNKRGWSFLNDGIGNSGNRGKYRKIQSPDGRVFNSIKEACDIEDVCRSVMRVRIKTGNWKYVDD